MSGAQRWAALEIRLVSAFVAVVEKGSFAAAARELGYTQSGVSQQVAALERIADCKLLIRHAGGRRPVQPTAAGRAMLAHSRPLAEIIKKSEQDNEKVRRFLASHHADPADFRSLPLQGRVADFIIVVSAKTGWPSTALAIDPW